jgi:threonine/homoserine/homoserine lactone efflux protein
MGILFISAVGLSLSFCAMPGVVSTEAIRRGLARGFRPAFLVELGSLIGDAVWAIIALIGVAFILQYAVAHLLLGITGFGLLLYLSWSAIQDARRETQTESKEASSQGDFMTGALLSLGNPFQVAFWVGISGSAVSAIISNPQTTDLVVFFIGFMVGGLLWSIILSGIVAWGRRLLNPAFFRWVNLSCGVLLGYFGIQLLWNTVQTFLAST